MKVLYIGGTGEISYSCVLAGSTIGQQVTVFNRGRNSETLPQGVKSIIGDLNDDASYAQLGQQIWDVVCQFKAYELKDIQRDLKVFSGKVGQYVFISTASAYQKPPKGYVMNEDLPLANPYWAYSQTKADMEKLLMQAHTEGKLPLTIVRPSHTIRQNFPGTFIKGDHHAWRMLKGKPTIIHGDGTGLWTITHAEDFARPFVRLLGNPKAIGEAFHITRHMQGHTWNQILQAMADALGVEGKYVHVPSDTIIRYNSEWIGPLLGDKANPVLFDNTKVFNVAGKFGCKFNLQEALNRALPYVRKRMESYQVDLKMDALIDRMIADQYSLGTSQ